jgi:hypothetical protein
MPIRFRCAYCNQLLGIARRKSGTVVRCPTCAGQVVVPATDEIPAEEAPNEKGPAPTPAAGPRMFEGSEIDKLLEGAGGEQPSALGSVGRETMRPAMMPQAAAAPAPAPAPMQIPMPVMPAPAPAPAPAPLPMHPPLSGPRPPGIWLSPARATLLSVLAVIALAVSFGVGLVVGLFIGHR